MSDSGLQKQKGLAVTIAKSATDSERVALTAWIEGMLEIRDSTDSALTKAQKAVTLTSSSGVILPIIKSIGRELTPAALGELSEGLNEIYRSQLPPVEKLKRASSLALTKTKEVAWDDRGLAARVGLVGAISGLVVFGSQGAGIAALGTAIGVPLWVVFGAGGAFLAMLYEELTGKRIRTKGKAEKGASYRVIEVKKNK